MARRRAGSPSGRSGRTRGRSTIRHTGPSALAATPPAVARSRPTATGLPAGGTAPAEAEALVVTYWFDSSELGVGDTATIRLSGRRLGAHRSPGRGDTFVREEAISGVVPGSGPVSITTWVYGLTPGEWMVEAHLLPARPLGPESKLTRPRSIEPATWSWRRWKASAKPVGPVRTRSALLAPLAGQPAVVAGLYTALAVVGFVVALLLQAWLLSRQGAPVDGPLVASVIALVAGLAGAKAWYKVLHPEVPVLRPGWAVDGFLVTAPLVAAITLFAWDLPIGTVLDATAPGIFVAVTLGRVGCFVSGCCAGRCTASRWGIWSSDRRIGARRIPTQLLESAAGVALAVVTLLIVVSGAVPVEGAVFLASFVAYAAVRQSLLRLRAEQRRESRTLPLTAAAAGLVAAGVAVLSLLQGV